MTRLRRPFAEFVNRRTWTELLYALLGLPLGIAGFVFTVVTLALSGGLLVTFIGLPLLAMSGLGARWFGSGIRALANALLGAKVAPPNALQSRPGLLGWLGAHLRDGAAWRARLYLVLKLPLGIATFTVAVAFYIYGLGGLTYSVWRPFTPCNTSHDGRCHRGVGYTDHYYADTPARIVVTTLVGLLVLLAAPWVVRAVVAIDRFAVRALLGPSSAARVTELQQSRAIAVDDAATTLRRIERDLHDGAQARLVALAMHVGLAREKLAEGADPAETRQLLDTAHATAKDAIVELRDLARGIHPAVLDAGLATALHTLAATTAVPTVLETELNTRPEPAIETIAYFCAAELLANVGKHSDARRATLDARTLGTSLVLTVVDDGRGGARATPGGGLSGLAERVRTVDGTLSVTSPVGGPTSIRIVLPLAVPGSVAALG
jgi:signal transduction histidine kinase